MPLNKQNQTNPIKCYDYNWTFRNESNKPNEPKPKTMLRISSLIDWWNNDNTRSFSGCHEKNEKIHGKLSSCLLIAINLSEHEIVVYMIQHGSSLCSNYLESLKVAKCVV